MTEAKIDFQVLGPTEARRAGQPLPLSGARRRALVSRLLLDAGRVLPAATLVEDVWEGAATRPTPATLQSHVSQLRKVLGRCLQRRAGGYVLELHEARLDAAEFEALVARASAQLARGDGEAAADSLRGAIGLWRGRALQDVADQPWARPEAARLEELRRVAVEQLLLARLQAGEHEHMVGDAEAAVADEPLREQRWSTLMLALYRSGRQADALRAYQRLRARLADELGVDPSPPVMALEAAILRQDPGLQPRVPAGRGDPADTLCDVSGALARARRATTERDWQRVCELLIAADGVAPLDAEDLELLGDAAFMVGEQQMSIVARQRAHSLWLEAGNNARAAVAALSIVGNHYVRNRPAIAAGWFHRGRRLLAGEPEGPGHGVLAFTGALLALVGGDPVAAADAAAQAQRVGVRFGQPDIEAVGLTLQGCALIRLGRCKEAEPMLDEALAWASSGQVGPIAIGTIFCWSTDALLAVSDFDRAAEWIEVIDSCGITGIPGDCEIHRAEILRASGNHDRARDEALAGHAATQAVHLLHAGTAHYELAMIHLVHGQLDLADRSFRHAAACGAPNQPGLALVQLARGDLAGAAASIRAALADSSLDELRRARLLPAAVQIALAAGDEAEASARSAELQQIAERFPTDGLLAASRKAQTRVAGTGPGVPSP